MLTTNQWHCGSQFRVGQAHEYDDAAADPECKHGTKCAGAGNPYASQSHPRPAHHCAERQSQHLAPIDDSNECTVRRIHTQLEIPVSRRKKAPHRGLLILKAACFLPRLSNPKLSL